jgi:hypothetical protein
MIVPEIKSLHSPDLPNAELPADPEDCAVLCEADIGMQGKEGADIFIFTVLTPKYLARAGGYRWGRGCLLVDHFSWDIVRLALQKLVSRYAGNEWREIAVELNKELHWEFDNYQAKA